MALLGLLGSYFNYKALSFNEIGIDLVILCSEGYLFEARQFDVSFTGQLTGFMVRLKIPHKCQTSASGEMLHILWCQYHVFLVLVNSNNLNMKKHRAYHSWQWVFRNPADFMCEIRWISCLKSGRFQVKSSRFHTWNPVDFTPEICQISWNLYEICWISPEIHMKSGGFHLKSVRIPPDFMNVRFCVMIKYRSFFRKTKNRH